MSVNKKMLSFMFCFVPPSLARSFSMIIGHIRNLHSDGREESKGEGGQNERKAVMVKSATARD